MKLLAFVHFLVLATIVVLADRGELDQYVSLYKRVPFGDTLGHFILMGVFSFLVNSAFRVKVATVSGHKFLVGSLVVFGIVLAEECSQLFFVDRTFSLLDLTADVAGIWLFGQVARIIYEKRRLRMENAE